MDVLVFGAGSLGSLLGGILAREHSVTLVGRDPHVATVAENGLYLTGVLEERIHPLATTEPPSGADLVLVTVKAFETEAAARALVDTDCDIVCSLQNGLGNEEILADTLGGTTLAGTCTYGARLEEPGVVACTGIGDVTVGDPNGGVSEAANRVGDAFEGAGLQTTVASDMPRRLWEKLAVNAGINPVTALADVDNGALLDGSGGEPARAAARETAQVAREAGVDLADGAAVEALVDVARATAANTSSMRQDVLAGSRTEIDALNGAVARRASAPVPVNETLAALVRSWEEARGLR